MNKENILIDTKNLLVYSDIREVAPKVVNNFYEYKKSKDYSFKQFCIDCGIENKFRSLNYYFCKINKEKEKQEISKSISDSESFVQNLIFKGKISYKDIINCYSNEIKSIDPSKVNVVQILQEISNSKKLDQLSIVKYIWSLYGKIPTMKLINLLNCNTVTFYKIRDLLGLESRNDDKISSSQLKQNLSEFLIINKKSIYSMKKYDKGIVILIDKGTDDYVKLVKQIDENL